MRSGHSPVRAGKCALVVLLTCALAMASALQPPRSWAWSLSEEKELGQKILELVREQMPLIEDGEIVTYVRAVGDRVARQVGTTTYQYRFFVVNEATPNAFAVPGGYIFIYRGLIELMNSEGELASILAHEVAHIQARHIQRRMEESRIVNIASLAGVVAGILLGVGTGQGGGGQALALGSMAGGRAFELKYSRENEEEADQLGFRYLCTAGYPPRDMVTIMQSMGQSRWRTSSKMPSYLSTHPALDYRVQYLSEMVKKEKTKDKKDKPASYFSVGDFALMQAALMAEYSEPQMVIDRYKEAAAKNDTAAVYGLGRLALRQGRLQEAVDDLQAVARQRSASAFVLSSLGAAYTQQNRLQEAQKVLRTAILLDPSASIVHLRLALVLMDLGQREEALQHLLQVEDLAPSFPEINYHLGVLLGQMNRQGLAHYYLGLYYEQKRDWKTAIFHYGKAKALLTDSPQKREEVDRLLKNAEKKVKQAFWEKARKQ